MIFKNISHVPDWRIRIIRQNTYKLTWKNYIPKRSTFSTTLSYLKFFRKSVLPKCKGRFWSMRNKWNRTSHDTSSSIKTCILSTHCVKHLLKLPRDMRLYLCLYFFYHCSFVELKLGIWSKFIWTSVVMSSKVRFKVRLSNWLNE